MIRSVKEAKEIANSKPDWGGEEIWQLVEKAEANGYLAALYGPEIGSLVMKIQMASDWGAVEKAITEYREAIK